MVRSLAGLLPLTIVCVVTLLSYADEKSAPRKQSQRPQEPVSAEPVSDAVEKAALGFARAQHPELADLLDALRRSNLPAYQSALRDVSRDAERLKKMAERDAERYQLSLQIWNLDSRIRLEIARLSMSSDSEVESRLRPMIEERQAVRIALLEVDYQRQKERFEKVSEQLAATRKSSDDRVAAEIDRIQRLISAKSKTRTLAAGSRSEKSKPSNVQTGAERPKTGESALTDRFAKPSSASSRKKSADIKPRSGDAQPRSDK
ncbi:hypothetical protein GC176_06385 [bacterium]|nr:hypothetical protein [bacterium]